MLPCFTVSNLIPGVSVYIRSFTIRIWRSFGILVQFRCFESVPEERILLSSMHHARSF
jgi:hypothetical protein